MIDKIKKLRERMMRAKRTTVFALLAPCDDVEKQSIIWIDCRIGLWLDALEEILVEAEQ